MATALTPKQAAIGADTAYRTTQNAPRATIDRVLADVDSDFDLTGRTDFSGETGLKTLAAPSKSGFGYLAWGSATSKRGGELLISVRGTRMTAVSDWLSNVDIGSDQGPSGFPVHSGFNRVAKSILPEIRSALRNKNPTSIHITGHSLGGAVATLLADALKDAGGVRLYTFGAPRVGKRSHSEFLEGRLGSANIFRTYHDTDPVPMVPIYPFCHMPTSETGYLMRGTGALVNPFAHRMPTYIASLKDHSWSNLPVMAHRRFMLETVDDLLAEARADSIGPAMHSMMLLNVITKILGLLLMGAVGLIGFAALRTVTVLDQMAAVLASGAAASVAVAGRIRDLIDLVMRFLGKTLFRAGTQITAAFLRWVLSMLFDVIAGLARRALSVLG